VQIAQVYAYRAERDKAFEWLERSIAQKDPGMVNLKTDPLLANLRSDPRFKALLRKMNLPV
jgi:serine/threonine-protein kinase